jgi:hypothetical protein
VGILVAAIVSVVVASPADEIRKAAHSELHSGYQTDMPHGLKRRPPATRSNQPVPLNGDNSGGGREWGEAPAPRGAGPRIPILGALMWVGAIVTLVLFAFFFAREFFGYSPDAEAEQIGDSPELAPDAKVVERPLGDAEQLAGQGLFGEAIHTLLLRTLEELKARHPQPIPSSYTSREILAQVSLGTQARDALAGLITSVEVSHFGGQEPGPTDYQSCLARFRTFATAYMGGAR